VIFTFLPFLPYLSVQLFKSRIYYLKQVPGLFINCKVAKVGEEFQGNFVPVFLAVFLRFLDMKVDLLRMIQFST